MSYYRRRRIRRLTILFVCFGAACALGAQVYRIGLRRSRAMTEAMRQQAVVSYSNGDYEKAVAQFAEYFDKSHAQETDPTAMFAYAESRVRVPEDRDQQVYDAIQLFQRYLANPDESEAHRNEARHQLLQLYILAWYSDEAVKLANTILTSNPRDVDALKAKVQALDEKKDERGALAACRQFNAAVPRNFWGQRVTVYLMKQTGASRDELVRYARSVQQAHPSDPMFEMVSGVAYELAGDTAGKKQWLAAAASHTPTDPELVADLVDRLDRSELFSDADGLIRRADQQKPAPDLDRMLVRRLWEDGDYAAVLDRTAEQDPRSASADSEQLVYRTLALIEMGRKAEAGTLARVFAGRHDRTAANWAPVLAARLAPPAPVKMVQSLQDAISRDPKDGTLHYLLGQAWYTMGESEPALGELKQTVALSPAWAAPHLLGARIFGETSRFNYALDSAIAAEKRRPDQKETRIAHALALYHFAVANGRSDLYEPLLKDLEAAENRWHDPALIPARIDLLNGAGHHDAAVNAAREACNRSPALPAGILLQIAFISHDDSLGQEQALRDTARKIYGLTPQIAMADARALHQAGEDQKGLQLLEAASKTNSDNTKDWRLAIAQYREMIGDLNALRDFELAGNDYPADLQVQRAISYSRSRTRDREFWQQTIDRLKSLTGPDAIEWKAERARYLLDGDWTENDRDEAMKLLNDVAQASIALPEPHRLLAVARQKNNDVAGAFTEYQAAFNLRPADPLYATSFIQFLVDTQRNDEAVSYLDKFCEAARLTNSTREWAARQYARAGHTQKAVALLQSEPSNPHRDALLVELSGEPSQSAARIPAGRSPHDAVSQ